jgi:hypothetical protein
MNKLLKKGAMGAIIYMQKLQVDDSNQVLVHGLSEVLATFQDIFKNPKNYHLQETLITEFHSKMSLTLSTPHHIDCHLNRRTQWNL